MRIWLKGLLGVGVAAGLVAFHQHEFAEHRLESPLPPQAERVEQPQKVLTWVGAGTAYAWQDGEWQRDATQDYEFSVVQRRYDRYWKSVKTMHRRHPDYDGSAGPRDQVHYFRVNFDERKDGRVPLTLTSSMGAGSGHTDKAYKSVRFDLELDAPTIAQWFMPYNRLKFDQTYDYAGGALREEIVLVKADGERERPAFRIVESARLFASGKMAEAASPAR